MATRNQATVNGHLRGKGEAAMPIPGPKGVAQGAAKHRRALDDIGNLVKISIAEGKPITRPITRSFGAKLLANAQAAAANNAKNALKRAAMPTVNKEAAAVLPPPAKGTEKNSLGHVSLPVNGAAERKPSTITNSKPEATPAIPAAEEMSVETVKSKSPGIIYTLSYVLSARSKLACGIKDIDAGDSNNELAMSDYVEDLYLFYKTHEKACRPRDYMNSQLEISVKMRSILVDWLIDAHNRFELMPETLFLTISIVDRFLSLEMVPRKELQLVGVSAMLIASKYEEIAPAVLDFICICDKAYTRQHIIRMEKTILNKLGWSLTFPTAYVFIIRFLKAASSDNEMNCMAFFFSELALMHYPMVACSPSLLSAAAVYAARCTLKKSPAWNTTLEYYTGYSENHLMECAKLMVGFHSTAPGGKLKAVYKKYADEEFQCVSLKPPAMSLLH